VAKLIISRDAQLIAEVELGDGRVTIGRHPASDVVLAHQAVSGRHAAITNSNGAPMVEDLGSSNGTFVNGQRIASTLLADRDRITVAKFQLEYIAASPPAVAPPAQAGSIEVMNGASAGKLLSLVKPLTTLGSPGVLVVVISRQAGGYYIAQVQGNAVARVNDETVNRTPRLLRDGDLLELTGTHMRFSTGFC
jgi:predicted component of type VI protein secretion system